MNIFIMGGGRVGSHLAELLSEEQYDVTVIEQDPTTQEKLDLALNARVVLGDGASALLLQSLQVEEADLFVACTGSDETNLIAAAAAKNLGAHQVLARVEKKVFVEESYLYEGILNIDYLLSPDALVAQEIVNFILYPGILASEEFARGKIHLRQVQVHDNTPAANKLLRDILPPGSGVLVGVLEHNGTIYIPDGSNRVAPGDKVTLIGERKLIQNALLKFQGKEPQMQHVVIMGGGGIGRWIAHSLEGKIEAVRLFELNPEKARSIAEGFRHKNIQVTNRDATSKDNLEQEHVKEFDLFVATTEDDERNIIAGVLGRDVGIAMSAVVVHHPDFKKIVERLGITMAVTPRTVISNSIIRILRQQSVSTSSILREGDVEVLEIALGKESRIIGKKLYELTGLLPHHVIIATIMRNEQAFVPGGDATVESGDSLVVIAKANTITEIRRVLQGD